MLNKGIKARSATKAFKISNESFEPGSLIITQRNNESVADFDNVIQTLAKQMDRKIYTSTTGFVDAGKDFGSGYVSYLKAPRVAMLTGETTFSTSTGEIWYFFEQQLKYPITQIGTWQRQ